MSLPKALAAAQKGDNAATLAQLVAAWKKRPAVALVDAITEVARLADAEEPPLEGTKAGEREAAWQARAQTERPAALGVLLKSLLETKGSAQTQGRLVALTPWCQDPRLAEVFAGMMEKPPYNCSVSRTLPFWKFLFAALPKVGDPRLLARAKQWPEQWKVLESEYERDAMNGRWKKLMPELEKAYGLGVPELTPEDAKLCADVVALAKKQGGGAAKTKEGNQKSVDQALREVYENPADDAPRLVLSDLLQEQGDPRGEFIALQFVKEKTAAQAKREKALFAKHQKEWLGAIAPLVLKSELVFERGFASRCRIKAVDASPEWATVTYLEGLVTPVEGGHFDSVRSARTSMRPAIAQLKHLRELAVVDTWLNMRYRRDGDKATPEFGSKNLKETYGALPQQLEALSFPDGSTPWAYPHLTPRFLDWIWEGPGRALKRLSLTAPFGQLDAWREVAEKRKLETLALECAGHYPKAFRLTIDVPTNALTIDGVPMELKPWDSQLKTPTYTPPPHGTVEMLTTALKAARPFSKVTVTQWKASTKELAALGVD